MVIKDQLVAQVSQELLDELTDNGTRNLTQVAVESDGRRGLSGGGSDFVACAAERSVGPDGGGLLSLLPGHGDSVLSCYHCEAIVLLAVVSPQMKTLFRVTGNCWRLSFMRPASAMLITLRLPIFSIVSSATRTSLDRIAYNLRRSLPTNFF